MMPFRRLCASLTVLVLVLVAPGQAHAASGWPGVSVCTRVEGLGGTVSLQGPPEDVYTMMGDVSACPGADDPQARWSVARYRTGAPGVVAAPVSYPAAGGQFHFLYKRQAASGAWAICVVNDVRPTEADPARGTANRVACVGPDPAGPTPPTGPVPTGPNGPILRTRLVPLSIDDPRFEGAVVVGESARSRPACAGCV